MLILAHLIIQQSNMNSQASTRNYIILHPDDNVAVAMRDFNPGEKHNGIVVPTNIPMGHKFAIRNIGKLENVVKFGHPIGFATQCIALGEHVHQHNVETQLEKSSFSSWIAPRNEPQASLPPIKFDGFARAHQRTATRNEIWIINTVACVNQTANLLAERARCELAMLEHIDGFYAFPHPYGCSQLGDDLINTQMVLSGLINHPHAAGVLLLGLGCENNALKTQLKSVNPEKLDNLVFFNTQDVADELSEGFEALQRLAETANQQARQFVPANNIVLGMKCGGSDGLSGITANPLLGRIADRHCQMGGTVLLTEVPEMFGAEPILLSRCTSSTVHQQVCNLINQFKDYFIEHNQPISKNPSPGNVEGGITTLEEKSLGCVQKGGTRSLIKEVLAYGAPATPNLGGIALVNSPGNDGVSTTAMVVAGANIILFTTGRGTPLGAPVPTIKISTNSELAQQKPSWIDFDAGQLLNDQVALDELAEELYAQILAVAAGDKHTLNERNGYREIAIWKTGVTL